MKVLVILRGAPGCGKSTWVRDNGLEACTVSSDAIRTSMSGMILTTEGKFGIDQSKGRKVWDQFIEEVELRMQTGQFIVADATHTKPSDFNKYKQLVNEYGYKAYCVDFSYVSLDVLLKRNFGRDEYKHVPKEIVEKFYHNVKSTQVPHWVTTVAHTDLQYILDQTVDVQDFSKYRKVHHLGDIHGAIEPLTEYLPEIKDDEAYVFVGDFTDRGNNNAKVLEFISRIYEKDNVYLLEGNHDGYVYQWAKGKDTSHEEFEFNTRLELEGNNFDKELARKIYRSMRLVLVYTHGKKTVVVSHGGISTLPKNLGHLALVPAKQLIKGVGTYKSIPYDAWMSTTNEKCYMVHGHRNKLDHPVRPTKRCFNLEGKIEFGGHLRVAVLDAETGWSTVEVKNNNYRKDIKPLAW